MINNNATKNHNINRNDDLGSIWDWLHEDDEDYWIRKANKAIGNGEENNVDSINESKNENDSSMDEDEYDQCDDLDYDSSLTPDEFYKKFGIE